MKDALKAGASEAMLDGTMLILPATVRYRLCNIAIPEWNHKEAIVLPSGKGEKNEPYS